MAITATKQVSEIVLAALKKIGVVDKDEPIDSQDQTDAIEALDFMLKSWQLRGVRLYTVASHSQSVADATSNYTITPKLHNIQTATWKDSAGLETEMIRITDDEYRRLPDKDAAGRAVQYYYDRQKETGTLYVWPVLTTADSETIEIRGTREVEDISASTDVVDCPAEWYEAVVYGLAARLADDFEVTGETANRVTLRAEQLRAEAEGWDREESVFIMPDYRYSRWS